MRDARAAIIICVTAGALAGPPAGDTEVLADQADRILSTEAGDYLRTQFDLFDLVDHNGNNLGDADYDFTAAVWMEE